MGTFLYIVLGAVLGIVLVPLVVWVFFKFFFKGLLGWYLKRLQKKLANLGALYPPVPPFRLTLVENPEPDWQHGKSIEQATMELEAIGYQRVGDFTIREIYQIGLRALVNPESDAYAVLYDFAGDSPGVVVDLVVQFTDETGVTCSNAPIEGLDEPPWEKKFLVEQKTDEGAIAGLAAKLAEATAGRDRKPAAADLFVKVFQDAYGRKMDWQVNRGGPNADELRRNLVLAHGVKEDEIDPQAIELTQAQWRSAIARFVAEKTRERFLRHVTKMSASQWEDVRDRLFIVHELSLSDELLEVLKAHLMELADDDFEEDHEFEQCEAEIETKLRPHFAQQPPRAAFESAQAELPERQRYKRIARITGPWPADVYVEPQLVE